jgi:hypothetical protein
MDDDLLTKAPKVSDNIPAPPSGPPPAGGFRFGEVPQLVEMPTKPKLAPQGESAGLPKSPEPWPVPDWVVFFTASLVNFFMLGLSLECCIFIIYFGSYMHPGAVWATHGATFVGFTINLVLFESIKCLVVAMVALAQDRTIKRQADIAARRARMALKAQRLQERNWKWRQDAPLPSLAAPPLLG